MILAAVALFPFYSHGLYQWIRSGYRFGNVWQAITSDWFLAITVLDTSLFSLRCLPWLYGAMRKQMFSGGKMRLIPFSTLTVGVVVLLLSLAFRKANTLSPPSALFDIHLNAFLEAGKIFFDVKG